jgi:hypothetical protein
MKSIKHFFKGSILFILFTVAFSSCDTETMPVTSLDGNSKNDEMSEVNIFKEDAAQYVVNDIIDQDSILVFSGNTPKNILPTAGETVFIPITEKTPYGFLGKVKSIKENGNFEIETETVALDEIFETLSVDTVFSMTNKLLGCYDENGNPIEYEFIEDNNQSSSQLRVGGYADNMNSVKLKIPVKFYDGKVLSLEGAVTMSLDDISFNLDINNFRLDYFNFNVSPGLNLELNFKAAKKTPDKWEKSTLICAQIFAPITIPTPIGIPIILRPKVYLFLVYGATGEVSITSTVQYQCSSTYGLKYQNGQWSNIAKNNDLKNEQPWMVSETELSGGVYAGDKIGFLCGLYSATTGFGANIIAKLKAESNFKFSFNDLMFTKPEVKFSAVVQGELYFTASIFGKKIAHYSTYTPEYVAWSQKIFLLPQINNFSATGNGSSSGTVSYQVDSHSLLSWLGVTKHGFSIFDSSDKEIKTIDSPPNVQPDNKGIYSYNIPVDNLEPNKDYYAAPAISFFPNFMPSNFKWNGKKEKFNTEGNYTLYFRCENQDYDVIVLDFSLNDASGNVINVTKEASDYDGSLMRVNIKADYSSNAKLLSGTFDFYFYDNPEQRRIDGFNISLTNDDSGYVTANKVIDNGGCVAALRIVRTSPQIRSSMKSYDGIKISENSCNEGFMNNHKNN